MSTFIYYLIIGCLAWVAVVVCLWFTVLLGAITVDIVKGIKND